MVNDKTNFTDNLVCIPFSLPGLMLTGALQTILNLCITDKEFAKKLIPKVNLYFPKSFMIFLHELLDAAVSLWTNIIPKRIMKKI
jgi:hypothetical protein